ncbi:acetyl-CoA carboxylase biotin carboxyl carrier protein subunit [Bacteroidia bacterium]|nr:acetyl-CoA carboxylase biotin carboxyl carrier protein subunit [Bacteroidia bacterium]GHT39841.1 acetyl-CoA carboxylase biotin carboxyl carrier protein subunit [Bacteroidia bacterium]
MKNFKYIINGNIYNVEINSIEGTMADVEVNGTPYKVQIDRPTKTQVVTVKRPAQAAVAPVSKPVQAASAGALRSPLPGIILDINVKVGDAVKKGQKVLVLEAMKMENAINADRDGEIKDIKVNKGESVLEGAELLVIG